MVYEEISIPAIQKQWEIGFEQRYRLFSNTKDRDHTLEVMLRQGDPDKADQTHPVTLKVFVKSDKDTEQLILDTLEPNKSQEKHPL
jgi:hypothetical protein